MFRWLYSCPTHRRALRSIAAGHPATGASIKDRYQTTALLGEGAFGRTFAARDTRTGGEVVLKQIAVRGLPGWKPVEYFEREVAVLRTLDHPGVPRFVDAFQTDVEGEGP